MMDNPLACSLWRILALLLLAGVTGCGAADHPETFRATGVVRYQGKPVDGAQVTFMTEQASHAAIGKTDAEGKFTLGTFEDDDGAVAGTHVVTITKAPAETGAVPMSPNDPSSGYGTAMSAAAASAVQSGLPEKYASRETSGLTAEVTKTGPNEFTFDLE